MSAKRTPGKPLADPGKGKPDDEAKAARKQGWARPKTKSTRDKWREARVANAMAAMGRQS